jgi:tetratricopeptide (TPR) repeat protein
LKAIDTLSKVLKSKKGIIDDYRALGMTYLKRIEILKCKSKAGHELSITDLKEAEKSHIFIKSAIDLFTEAINRFQNHPKIAEIYYQRGCAYMLKEDKKNAQKDFDKAYKLDPSLKK